MNFDLCCLVSLTRATCGSSNCTQTRLHVQVLVRVPSGSRPPPWTVPATQGGLLDSARGSGAAGTGVSAISKGPRKAGFTSLHPATSPRGTSQVAAV